MNAAWSIISRGTVRSAVGNSPRHSQRSGRAATSAVRLCTVGVIGEFTVDTDSPARSIAKRHGSRELPSKIPTEAELEIDYVEGVMTPSDIVDVLSHLKFEDGRAVLQVDKAARDYLVASAAARHGK
jgi:hypothetical protein